MKKFYMILAAIAALTFSAQAQIEGTINVGDWDGASTYNGSYFDMSPTNFYLAHTGSQMIFTPDLLADMEGKENVKITNLKFKFYCETYESIIRNAKVYLQAIDATEFAKNEDGIKQFFDFGEPLAETQLNIDMLEYYGEDCVLEFPVNFYFTPGKSLLVTIVFDAEDDDNCTMGSDYAPFYASGVGAGKAMTYSNNWNSFLDFAQGSDWPNSTAMLGCGTNVDLPLTEITYTYEEGQPGYYLVGTFNGWNQNADGGRIQFVEDKASAELEANAEFKLITPNAEGGWTWYGGEDATGVGYFLITPELMGGVLQLTDGANFRIEEAGTYNFTLVWTRDNVPGLMVEKDGLSAISTVGVDNKVDGAYYNMMGQRFTGENLPAGIYIHNGKKIIVK